MIICMKAHGSSGGAGLGFWILPVGLQLIKRILYARDVFTGSCFLRFAAYMYLS